MKLYTSCSKVGCCALKGGSEAWKLYHKRYDTQLFQISNLKVPNIVCFCKSLMGVEITSSFIPEKGILQKKRMHLKGNWG